MLQTNSQDLLHFLITVINSSITSSHTWFKRARVIPILEKPTLDPSDIGITFFLTSLNALSTVNFLPISHRITFRIQPSLASKLHIPQRLPFRLSLRSYMLLDHPNYHQSLFYMTFGQYLSTTRLSCPFSWVLEFVAQHVQMLSFHSNEKSCLLHSNVIIQHMGYFDFFLFNTFECGLMNICGELCISSPLSFVIVSWGGC